MHILLTNDDGFDAPGLMALHRAIDRVHRITVVAPRGQRSTCGHASTLAGPVDVQQVTHDLLGDVFTVAGTPVDCVRLGVAELADGPVDCVVSGINQGANVSVVDVAQSGTVAAAREAAFCGIRGIAVSQMYRKNVDTDWDGASRLVSRLLPQLLDVAVPASCFWNVNLPCLLPGEEPAGVRLLPASTDQIPLVFTSEDAPSSRERTYHYRGVYSARTISPGTDVAAVFENEIAVTPMMIDPTDKTILSREIKLAL
ncbi:MAG: 5'/3'-nucleotidase SurE [Phycisphaerae bacterium]